MSAERLVSWRNRWFAWSVGAVVSLAIASLLIGFIWLPSAQKDMSSGSLWDMICRAAGAPTTWYQGPAAPASRPATNVVLTSDFLQRVDATEIGRGATLAMQCVMCHGARGMSEAASPNLAGQYPDVVYKQLRDYRSGQRSNVVMQAMSQGLSDQNMRDLAAYYAFLPQASVVAHGATEAPQLVRVGDPLRNIPPCASCHGGIGRKIGSPWLEGAPAQYLQTQLQMFAAGTRRNDINGQMRNVARHMTAEEMSMVAAYYADQPALAGARKLP